MYDKNQQITAHALVHFASGEKKNESRESFKQPMSVLCRS